MHKIFSVKLNALDEIFLSGSSKTLSFVAYFLIKKTDRWSGLLSDTLLLQEIIVAGLFTFKPSIRERGKSWDDITARLNANPAFQNKLKQKRAVRDRYTLLAKKYKKKIAEEEAASGISPDHTEQEKL